MRAWINFLAAALPAAIKACKELRSSVVSVTLYFFMAESSRFRLSIRMQLHPASQKCHPTSPKRKRGVLFLVGQALCSA